MTFALFLSLFLSHSLSLSLLHTHSHSLPLSLSIHYSSCIFFPLFEMFFCCLFFFCLFHCNIFLVFWYFVFSEKEKAHLAGNERVNCDAWLKRFRSRSPFSLFFFPFFRSFFVHPSSVIVNSPFPPTYHRRRVF